MSKTYAYIRISTDKQDLENQKFTILEYANNRKLGNVEFIEETVSGKVSWKNRRLKDLIMLLQKGDNLIVAELSRLGRSMLEIMELLNLLLQKGINIYVVKGNYELKDDIQSKVLAFAFSLASEIERELISQRTKEALAKRKAEGKKLGRPKGSYSSKLDDKRQYIEELLDKGVSISSIAKILGVNYNTLISYVRKRYKGESYGKDYKSSERKYIKDL